jgi:hypothetical protein
VGIDVAGLEAAEKDLRGASKAKLTKALGTALHAQVPGSTAGAAKARAPGRMAARAAGGTKVRNLPDGVEMSAGGTEFLLGAEFGGRRAPRRRYVTRSKKGTAYVVNRRTTMQFHPWAGHQGYWFTPAWKASLQGVRAKLLTALTKAVDGG